jgi:hypothetical protein
MYIAEPKIVSPESEFDREVVAAAETILRARNLMFITIPKFGLDVAFFIGSKTGAKIKSLEFKCYAGLRPGGIGFGTPKGLGPQVDLLRNPAPGLALAESFIRWAFVDALLPAGNKRYALVDSIVAKAGAMGEVKTGKQNNFRISSFRPYLTGWNEFIVSLENYLTV